VAGLGEGNRVATGIALTKRLLDAITEFVPDFDTAGDQPDKNGSVLKALELTMPDGSVEEIPRPLIPLLDTALLTNAPGEPRVGKQVETEIGSSDRVDVVMAFIRYSGIAPLLETLKTHCAAGRRLRILTTTYTGTTEARALDALVALGAEVRVSYDLSTTRLHAKAWLFHRDSGFSTAYIGSSNLTHSAQVTGLEWNLRLSEARNLAVLRKMGCVFDGYWEGGDFRRYSREEFDAQQPLTSDASRSLQLSPLEVRLEPFQERLLEQIALAREQGRHRNLLVAATGTGKTVMAAVDFARFLERSPGARLLFVAHREEILAQALATFRQALRRPDFGELWVGSKRPTRFDHVFASIQTLSANVLDHLEAKHFHMVIVDEFHHAAAPTYAALLDKVNPVELLGLTATPERGDGLPILHWFDGRIAAEMRLWDAIDQHRLVPFLYFGIADGTDLRAVKWRRGHGYDTEQLSRVLCANEPYARTVLQSVERFAGDVHKVRALAFCASVAHAEFMARVFLTEGVRAMAVSGATPWQERSKALEDLKAGRINVLFAVDLFNEGVDLPPVDTLLLLRPTDSATLFLQQLGRGLRRAPGKSACTVLDFVGQHRKEYRFDVRFNALLGCTRAELEKSIKTGFPYLPAGCSLQLDPVASEIVLRSLKDAIPSHWNAKVDALRGLMNAENAQPSLAQFLQETGLEVTDVYAGDKSWSDLCAAAGVRCHESGPHEDALRHACGRLRHVDDLVRLDTWAQMVQPELAPQVASLAYRESRLLRMLVASLMQSPLKTAKDTTMQEACDILWQHPQVLAELRELFAVLRSTIQHLTAPLDSHPVVPLQVHARYSRIEILAAFGIGIGDAARTPDWREGVYWAESAAVDILPFTRDKTSGHFSPTTSYHDYATNFSTIHWQSQNSTSSESPTGRRYRDHVKLGSSIMVFSRRDTADKTYHFLGPATYVRHEGERPMSITWKLKHPLPGDIYAVLAAVVA
ncbi:MAG: DUF3427 domain-containing protein, partial [Planctomycetes bacterium]|nr:DUF3427 domain-containing protein [Planctomycetota bacterium]